MAHILNGKDARDSVAAALVRAAASSARPPTLALFEVGERPDSAVYIRQKKMFAERIGARVIHVQFPNTVSESELVAEIEKHNADTAVDGIIIQLPLPTHFNKRVIIETIKPSKDVDGLTSYNIKLLYENSADCFIPATTKGIMSLFERNHISLEGKRVTVVGRSELVGKPTAIACVNRNATVTIAHSHTRDLEAVCKNAEILIVAIGKPGFITSKHVSPGAVVVDVGINVVMMDGVRQIVGDVAFSDVEPIASAITPVPGGVGPMTVASLFENLIRAYTNNS